MSDRKRCPNCAWAFWQSRKLRLSNGASFTLIVIAEFADINLHYFATQATLAWEARVSIATVREHLQELIKAECIRAERTRGGYHYYLERPVEAFSRPEQAFSQPEQFEVEWPDVAEEEARNLAFREQDETPELIESTIQEAQILAVPIIKNPLEESLKEESPPAGESRVRAKHPTNVVALPSRNDRGARLPADWQPSNADIEFALTEGFTTVQITRTADRFADYWHTAAGAKARKVSWAATWRNWVRTDADRRIKPALKSKFEQIHEDNGSTSLWATMNAPEGEGDAITLDRSTLAIGGSS